MHEILFRAKAINCDTGYHMTKYKNGDWVYGLISRPFEEQCKNMPAEMRNTGGYCQIEVDHNTICEYTGLEDKNGTKIFEGDIIRTQPFTDRSYSQKAKSVEHIGVVEYKIFEFKNSEYQQRYKAEWIVKIEDYGKYVCFDWSKFYKCEVIGNIFDNPELLKGVEK